MAFYSLRHLLIILTYTVIPILWGMHLKKKFNVLKVSIISLFVLEIIRVVFLCLTNDFQINRDLSLQLCFTYPLVGLLYLFRKKDYILSFLGTFGILYGIVAITIMDPNPFLSFTIIQSYLYHGLMIFIGVYIVSHYKINFSFKSILIIFIQITLGMIANSVIKNGSNYIFLNTFLKPSYSLNYTANIEVFNLPIFCGNSINDFLIHLLNNVGFFYYYILFGLLIFSFSSLWLYLFIKKIRN